MYGSPVEAIGIKLNKSLGTFCRNHWFWSPLLFRAILSIVKICYTLWCFKSKIYENYLEKLNTAQYTSAKYFAPY